MTKFMINIPVIKDKIDYSPKIIMDKLCNTTVI